MITIVYFALSLVLLVVISLSVILKRRRLKITYGYGRNYEIADIVSAHSNFVAYTPFSLMLIAMLEFLSLANFYFILMLAILMFAGRVMHFQGLYHFKKNKDFKLRVWGMHLTLWPMIAGSLALLIGFCLNLSKFVVVPY